MKLSLALPLLVTALSQSARAVPYISAATGNWSNPATWTAGVGFPETYLAADSATIDPTHIVSYDGSASAPLGGNLLVAAGNSININGGTLNQTWIPGAVPPFGTAIAIGVSHPLSGVGTLNIDAAGTFDSGTANAVAVGISNAALGTAPGVGVVNVNDGSAVIGVGAGSLGVGALGLAVGIDTGGNGTLNVGDGVGAASSATVDLLTNNALLTIGGTNTAGGGTGLVNIKTDGRLSTGSQSINLGEGTGNGTLTVDGILAAGTGGLNVGRSNSTGTLNINAGASAASAGELNVGSGAAANGTANINGGTTSVGETSIGRGTGTGIASVNGGDTTVNGKIFVGRDAGSTGTLELNSGNVHVTGVVDQASSNIGQNGNGNLEISGGTFASDNSINVGLDGGIGIVNQTGGSVTYGQWAAIGLGGGGAGSTWNISGGTIGGAGMEVGADRDGTMNVSGTANVVVPGSTIGVRTGGDGKLNVSGGRFQTTGNFSVGGGQSAGIGTVEYTGGVLETGEFRLGITGGNGTINVRNGAFLQHGWGEIGTGAGATGNLNIIGPTASYVHTELAGDFQVGYNGGTGNINISGGGKLTTNWWMNLSRGAGSNSTVNVSGPGSAIYMDPTNNGGAGGEGPRLNIGEDSIGTMNLSDSALLQLGMPGSPNRELYVGRNGGSDGLLTVRSGSEVHADGNWSALIGQVGKGRVDVEGGGKFLANNWLVVGNEAGSDGTVNIGADAVVESGTPFDGGVNEGRLITGRLGRALVNQSAGTVRADNWFAIGIDGGGEGTYNMSGGTIELYQPNYGDRNVIVANNGRGTMNITDARTDGDSIISGIVDPTFGNDINQFNVGADSNGNGLLNINLADPAGVVVHRELYVAWAQGGSTVSQGVVNVYNGTLRTDGWVEIGRGQVNSGGTGTVNIDGPNARWERGTMAPSNAGDRGVRDMNIGQGENPNFGKGYLNVKNGGKVNHNWWINLARQPGSEGHIVVEGAGSMINMVDAHLVGLGGDGNSQLNVGEGGTGTLDIRDGGVFNHNMDNGGGEVWIARNDGSSGRMTVEGVDSQFNSYAREFRIAANNGGNGSLNINDGAVVNFSSHRENGIKADGNFGVAENNASTGAINMDGGTLNVAAWSLFGAWNQPATRATITMTNSTINIINDNPIDGGGNPTTGGHLFWGDAGTATINQEGGAINAQGWSAIGRERGGDAFYNLGVNGGGGTMTIGGGGGNELYVGRQSHGTINMGPGTTITVANLMNLAQEVSPTTPSKGTVTNEGGTLNVGGEFNVGRNGDPGNQGFYEQTDGNLNVTGEVFVGRDSTQGSLIIGGGTATLSSNVFLGAGGGTGTFGANSGLTNVAGSFTVNTGSSLNVGWDLNVRNGIVVDAGNLNITGTQLQVNGTATVGNSVSVGSGGVLAGTGTVTAGGVTILSGGAVSPGTSPGTLTIEPDITVNVGGSYVVEIAGVASYDKLVATSGIQINGTVSVVLSGYIPVAGDAFDIADAASIGGVPSFDFTSAVLTAGLEWDTTDFLTTGTIKVKSNVTDPYDAWATSYGLTGGKAADDDADGASNLLEFATNSDPTTGNSGARSFGKVATIGADQVLTLTVAIRNGAAFAADGANQKATKDNVAYTVEASDTLGAWNAVVVTELGAVDAAAVQATLSLPTLDAGWEWHTFRTDDTLATDNRDLVRLTVAVAP